MIEKRVRNFFVQNGSSQFGHLAPQIAADWLVAHVHDPHLDQPVPRTFVLYLCPSSGTPLQKQLQTFWDASSTQVA
jgi:hypothetical protein